MDNDINMIKRYIEKKDYNNLEDILKNFIIPLEKILNKNFDIICFTIKNESNINRKYNNMSLLKYLICNKYFNEENISILVKNKYEFSWNDFEILFQKDFNLILLTFKEITLFNKDFKNKYNNNVNTIKNKRRIFEIIKEKEKIEIIMQEITLLLKYERSKEKLNKIKFFDHQFKYLNKNSKNDIEFHFLHEIIEKILKSPITKMEIMKM
ncbi:hypothetical protein H8356DRAFT_1357437 [Neocallimastix lanati (nom. inval.)]|nr:hypothetical protein H8356DRAFT_1357437 [Neocallimastix sp. JGI-2020a]